jgi:diaminopimelate epimerase
MTADALPFRKMHGLGNDFVVVDARARAVSLDPAAVRAIADRRTGVGFDELLIIERPRDGGDAFMGVRNADGSVSASCGNGARCVAGLLMTETGKDKIVLETAAGPVIAWRAERDLIAVDMGPAYAAWNEIPLREAHDTLHVPVSEGPLKDPVAVSVGNPHAVFFVPDVAAIDLATIGAKLERHPMFPERANIEIVQVLGRKHLRMRVWERGAGITRACGTGACAVGVAAARRGVADRAVTITLDGGDLQIVWREDGHVIMTGPIAESFSGTLDPSLLPAAAGVAA